MVLEHLHGAKGGGTSEQLVAEASLVVAALEVIVVLLSLICEKGNECQQECSTTMAAELFVSERTASKPAKGRPPEQVEEHR